MDQKLIKKHLAQIYLFRLCLFARQQEGFKPVQAEPVKGRLIQIYSETRDEQESGLSVIVFVSIRRQSLLEDVLKHVVFS